MEIDPLLFLVLFIFIQPTLDSVKTVTKVHGEKYALKTQDVFNPPKVR